MNQHTYKVGSPLRINRFLSDMPPAPSLHPSSSPKTPRTSSSHRSKSNGRFIPTKISKDLYQMFCDEFPSEKPKNKENQAKIISSSTLRDRYKAQLYSKLLIKNISQEQQTSLLKFTEEKRDNSQDFSPNLINYGPVTSEIPSEIPRKINKTPYKKLDAPGLREDFYLNLLDWSCQNFLAIGLDRKLYTWSASNNTSHLIAELEDEQDYIGAIAWSQNGQYLSLGNNLGQIKLYDMVKQQAICSIQAHSLRIGSLAWNGNLLASGSRDKKVKIIDIRNRTENVAVINSHKQEICGLKWSFDENLLASGGNDNRVVVWSLRSNEELVRFTSHTAAVKALAWSPHQYNVLATGGGTSDRTIRFWDTHNLREIDCVDSGSQVCNLMFSKNVNEIVSTHGYSLNQINVWKYPAMEKLAGLSGHSMRVLYLAGSPCGENIVTGAGDETLMFWNVFPGNRKNYGKGWEEFGGGKIDLR